MRLLVKHRRCLLLCVLFVLAEIPTATSVIVAEQAMVQNDTMEVLFVAKALSSSPESAVLGVVTLSDWALSYQSSYPEVMMLQATPQKAQHYNPQQKLTQWSATQEIKIRGENLAEMHALTSELLNRLEPLRVQFLLSEKQRAKIEEVLLHKVLHRYESKSSSFSTQSQNYIRITADNLSNAVNQAMSKAFLKARSLDTDFQPGFSIIKVELIGI